MNITFLTPAETELLDAVAYYNSQSEGLGYEFAAAAPTDSLTESFIKSEMKVFGYFTSTFGLRSSA